MPFQKFQKTLKESPLSVKLKTIFLQLAKTGLVLFKKNFHINYQEWHRLLWEYFVGEKNSGFLTNKLQSSSYELLFIARVTSYCLLHDLRVTNYCTSYELVFTYELRVTIYWTSYEFLFTYESRVSDYLMNYEIFSASDK